MRKSFWKKYRFYIVTGAIFLCVVIFSLFFGKVLIISGRSMEPTYYDGDMAVAVKVSDYRDIEVGDICVFKYDSKELIKRVAEIRQDGFWVLGDNAENSHDSRAFGVVPYNEIQYKVAFSIPSTVKKTVFYSLVFIIVAYFAWGYLSEKKEKNPDTTS